MIYPDLLILLCPARSSYKRRRQGDLYALSLRPIFHYYSRLQYRSSHKPAFVIVYYSRMRLSAIFPLLCALTAFILSLLCLFAGSTRSFLQNGELLTVRSPYPVYYRTDIVSSSSIPPASAIPTFSTLAMEIADSSPHSSTASKAISTPSSMTFPQTSRGHSVFTISILRI